VVIVWDNFESTRGMGGSASGLLPPEDLPWIKLILEKLRGGKAKILLTSRGEETWLGTSNFTPVRLLGLQGEERWEFCGKVLRDLGLAASQKDASLVDLLETLSGHPLLIRAVLPRLKWMSAAVVVAEILARLEATSPGETNLKKKLAA